MPAQSFDQNGALQYDTELYTYFLRKTGTCTSQSGGPYSTTMQVPGALTYPNALVGFSGGEGYAVGFSYGGAYSGSDYWNYIVEGTGGISFNYYIFERSDNLPSAGYGEECYNAAGQRTWSAAYRPLRGKKILYQPTGTASTTISGKTLGFIPTAYAAYNRYEDSEEPGSYYHDWSVYAAANGNTAGTLEASSVYTRIVEVPGGRGVVFGSRPPDTNQFEIPGKFLVFDASNIPASTTFY